MKKRARAIPCAESRYQLRHLRSDGSVRTVGPVLCQWREARSRAADLALQLRMEWERGNADAGGLVAIVDVDRAVIVHCLPIAPERDCRPTQAGEGNDLFP